MMVLIYICAKIKNLKLNYCRRGSTDVTGPVKRGESCTDTSTGKKGQPDNDTGMEIDHFELIIRNKQKKVNLRKY